MSTMKSPVFAALALHVFLLLSLVACGGGGGTATPNPNPGGQQQPPGGQQQPQAAPPNVGSIQAVFDDQAMAFTMTGYPGSALANANIVIEDPQSFTAIGMADASGSFVIGQGDIPPNFMTVPGTMVRVYQFTQDLARSEAANVTITFPNGST